MWVGRNFEKREALAKMIKEMELAEAEALNAIPEDVSDEEWCVRSNKVHEDYDTSSLSLKLFALEYPEVRNDWFKEFIQSFGVCEDMHVSAKQADVFYRYTEASHDNHYSVRNKKYARVGKLFIEFERASKGGGWVTIKELHS